MHPRSPLARWAGNGANPKDGGWESLRLRTDLGDKTIICWHRMGWQSLLGQRKLLEECKSPETPHMTLSAAQLSTRLTTSVKLLVCIEACGVRRPPAPTTTVTMSKYWLSRQVWSQMSVEQVTLYKPFANKLSKHWHKVNTFSNFGTGVTAASYFMDERLNHTARDRHNQGLRLLSKQRWLLNTPHSFRFCLPGPW